jgi:central glycolytic genes regulator
VDKMVALHRKIAPEMVGLIEDRFTILRQIKSAQPVGRRALAAALGTGERVVRAQVDFLKGAGFIDFTPLGMSVTDEGQAVLDDLAEYVRAMQGLAALESELAARLGVRRAVIVRGDADADPAAQRELGRAAAGVLGEHLGDNMTVAVSGGATMAWVAEAVSAGAARDVTVVPARGGLGEKVELQANTIAAVMAGKLGGRYRMLHMPDGVSGEALDVLLAHDASLRTVDAMIREADVVLHGIGLAEVMATRRVIAPSLMNELRAKGAAGEALGHYATLAGEIIHTTDNIGLRLEELSAVGRVIAVAGGRKKAAAIVAVTAAGSRDVLVTDEGAALAIREILKG